MGVIQKQLTSTSGFRSPGFSVDGSGNFAVTTIDATGALRINGADVLSTTTLASTVVNSSLTSVGTLKDLTVNSVNPISLSTTGNTTLTSAAYQLSATNITLNSSGAIVLTPVVTSNIDNFNIGSTTPGTGTFTTLSATDAVYVGGQNIKALSTALAIALS